MGLGSTTQLASSTGSVTDSYLYDSWGNILLASGATRDWFRYVGRLGYYYDLDTGMYGVRARVLNPSITRFLSVDPAAFPASAFIGGLIGSGALLDIRNRYGYAGNDPVNFVDPSGLIKAAFFCTPGCNLISAWVCCAYMVCIGCGSSPRNLLGWSNCTSGLENQMITACLVNNTTKFNKLAQKWGNCYYNRWA